MKLTREEEVEPVAEEQLMFPIDSIAPRYGEHRSEV